MKRSVILLIHPKCALAVLVVVSLALSTASGSCAAEAQACIRVALSSTNTNCVKAVVSSSSPLKVTSVDSGAMLLSVDRFSYLTIGTGRTQLILTRNRSLSMLAGQRVKIEAEGDSHILALDQDGFKQRRYRGSLDVSLNSGKLRFVNEIGLEDYLLGVVPSEMPQSYPIEALKAQAVCARTYAVANKSRHIADGCDLCDLEHCQVYGGAGNERASTNRAVNETSGVVVSYAGVPASVVYSADAGGITQDYSELRGNTRHPYLAGVTDPPEILHSAWEASISLIDIAAKLYSAGVKEAQGLTGVSVGRVGKSARALTLALATASGPREISGEKFRTALGTKLIKSNMYTIQTMCNGVIVFKGNGSGHGIGMCQTGTRALAQRPYCLTYDKILKHYFPGTEIVGATSTALVVAGRIKSNTEKVEQSAGGALFVPRGFDVNVRLEEPSLTR